MRICEYAPGELTGRTFECACGKVHGSTVRRITVGRGAMEAVPETVKALGGKRVFLVADENTFEAAGWRVCAELSSHGIECAAHLLGTEPGFERPEPTERTLGNLIMSFPRGYDCIVGVGGGVVNDLCKLSATPGNLPYVYVPSCPSMDGYTSDSASVIYAGVKSSVACKCPDAVLADTEIISKASSAFCFRV